MNNETSNAGPLERPVGRADGETMPGTEGFGSSDSNIRRNTRSTAVAPYGLAGGRDGAWVAGLLLFASSTTADYRLRSESALRVTS